MRDCGNCSQIPRKNFNHFLNFSGACYPRVPSGPGLPRTGRLVGARRSSRRTGLGHKYPVLWEFTGHISGIAVVLRRKSGASHRDRWNIRAINGFPEQGIRTAITGGNKRANSNRQLDRMKFILAEQSASYNHPFLVQNVMRLGIFQIRSSARRSRA